MSDDNIVEFKHPKILVYKYEDNPKLHETLMEEAINAWENFFNVLNEKGMLQSDIQALVGLTSCCINNLSVCLDKGQTLAFLEEHVRRLKTDKEFL